MDTHSSSSHCLRVNCVSLFFRLLFLFCFQQSNSGEPRCGFLWVYPAWVTWNSNICMLRFFSSNLRKFPQMFFWPNLSPSRTPITQTLDYLILSLTWHWGSGHFFSIFFFYSVLQLEWFLLTFTFINIFFCSAQTAVESSSEFFIWDTVFFSCRISVWLFLKFPFLYWSSPLLAHYVSMGLYLVTFFSLFLVTLFTCLVMFLLYAGHCR